MGISEVCSPVTRRGSKVASGQPMSRGARSAPGRGDQAAAPSVPPPTARVSLSTNAEEPATVTVVGPSPEE